MSKVWNGFGGPSRALLRDGAPGGGELPAVPGAGEARNAAKASAVRTFLRTAGVAGLRFTPVLTGASGTPTRAIVRWLAVSAAECDWRSFSWSSSVNVR